jgi:hypothetical protein
MLGCNGARTSSSCSGWMVATMSRMGPARGRSISAVSSALRPYRSAVVRGSSS